MSSDDDKKNNTRTIIDETVQNDPFLASLASESLNVTCYGSSSSKTPESYLQAARSVGYSLARRGHTCINGAGQYGCMAALNDGCVVGNGHIVGVIHEMFLVDSGYDDHAGASTTKVRRDGSAHSAFDHSKHNNNNNNNNKDGPTREILVATGNDLQQRKKLLVENADALIVLPGGPGTWDEVSYRLS